jgi:hypothetical protein
VGGQQSCQSGTDLAMGTGHKGRSHEKLLKLSKARNVSLIRNHQEQNA